MENEIILNKYGFYQLKEIPSHKELETYYAKKYYNNLGNSVSYEKHYSEKELKSLSIHAEMWETIVRKLVTGVSSTLLDIGCGEGFSMAYFYGKGYNVTGIDYSKEGILNHNRELIKYFIQGNIMEVLENLIKQGKKYDVILMQNLLEHVTDPEYIVKLAYNLLEDNGVVLVEVPNDYNELQQFLLKEKRIGREYWVCVPDHISYFNREGLINLFNSFDFKCARSFCTGFIELFALNDDTNYFEKPEKGKNCYMARMDFEQILRNISVEKSIDLYECMGSLGIGRSLLGVFIKK